MSDVLTAILANMTGKILIGIVIGLGFAAFLVWYVFRAAKPYMSGIFDKFNELRDTVLILDSQNDGRRSFAQTLSSHETRIMIIENGYNEIRDDIKDIKKNAETIFHIVDRRKASQPVEVDRRNGQ